MSLIARSIKIIPIKNLTISSTLGPPNPVSQNLNFPKNISDLEIKDLERLIFSLSYLRLSPFAHDLRA